MSDDDDFLADCMARLAAGDTAFVFTFHQHYGARLEGVVRSILRDMGRIDVARDIDEVGAMALDACLLIADRASGWKVGGAKPWTWAFRAIRSQVASSIGHRVVELGERDWSDGEAGSPASTVAYLTVGSRALDELGALITRHPRVGLLDRAIRAVGQERDQRVYWEYRIQQGMGDPSPAHTVADEFGLNSANVRQIARRHGARVWALIQSDGTYRPLRDHGWFAA